MAKVREKATVVKGMLNLVIHRLVSGEPVAQNIAKKYF